MGHREALALNREQPQCDLKQLAEGLNARSRTGPGKAGRLLMPLASFLHASGWPLLRRLVANVRHLTCCISTGIRKLWLAPDVISIS